MEFLALARDDTLEETMLQAMVIGAMKCDIETRLRFISGFIPKSGTGRFVTFSAAI